MVLNQRFDVMFNFQHKSDHTVHISHFSHTGQAPMGPSFSPAIGPLLPHDPADPRGAHLVLLAGLFTKASEHANAACLLSRKHTLPSKLLTSDNSHQCASEELGKFAGV